MKIGYLATTAHLSASMREGIGSTTHTYNVARELKELGNEILVISDRWEGDLPFEVIDGLRIYRLFRGGIVSAKRARRSLLGLFLAPFKPLSNWLLAWQSARIVEREGCDLLLERAQSKTGGIAALLTGKPLVVEVIDNLFSRLSLEQARRVFAYTDKFFDAQTKQKVELVGGGADLHVFRPAKEKPLYDACYVGSFKEWDGLEDLLKAVEIARQNSPRLRVALVGTGPLFEEIRKRTRERGLEENVRLLGNLSMAETVRTINASAIGLAPYNVSRSRKGEFRKYGFYFSPLKVVEYMACGKAVVATDYALIDRLLPSGNALVKEGDAQGLAGGILQLLNDPDRYLVERKNLLRAKKFSWRGLAQQMNAVFEEVAR